MSTAAGLVSAGLSGWPLRLGPVAGIRPGGGCGEAHPGIPARVVLHPRLQRRHLGARGRHRLAGRPMSINEPTGWSLDCDNWRPCQATYEPHDDYPSDEQELLEWAKDAGWITSVSPWSQYCSLDCLLTARASKTTRDTLRNDAIYHVTKLHQYDCCRMHGTHRGSTGGNRRHSYGCRKAGRLLVVPE